MIIITLLFYNLYEDSKYDSTGKRLSVKNTIKNMCGLYPLIRHTVRRSLKVVDDTATKAVKKIGCSNLKQLVEDNKLIVEDFDTINELSTFIVKGSSFEADDGCNDDMVACLFIFEEL